MAFATAEAEGSVQGALFLSAFIEASAETLDRFFRLCQARCLKRGHLTKKKFGSLPYCCALVRT